MLIFISHASEDRLFVEDRLLPFLHDHGVAAWCATAEIKTAEDWEHGIRSGLRTSDYFLVVLSANAIASQWVRAEVQWAVENRRGRVIPVLIDSCNAADLHLQLPLLQHIDLRADAREEWQKLAEFCRTAAYRGGPIAYRFLGRANEGHQVLLSPELYLIAIWDGADFLPIPMFEKPSEHPVIASLRPGRELKGDQMAELLTIPDGAGWGVRFYRVDFPDQAHCWFSADIIRAVNEGQYYVVPMPESCISIFGAEGVKQPLMTVILSCPNPKGGLSVLV